MRRLPPRWRTAASWLVTIGVAVLFVLVFEAEIAKPYQVPSASMEPTLHCARPADGCEARFSDRVLAAPIVYRFRNPERGDVAVFQTPKKAALLCGAGGTFVKRIIGLPGEFVSERNGYVYIDGKLLNEPYIRSTERDSLTKTWPRVPQGEYFMMGDNRADSCDSRQWGPVPRSSLKGPVVATYWPPNRISIR
jgi:signal peptidase I